MNTSTPIVKIPFNPRSIIASKGAIIINHASFYKKSVRPNVKRPKRRSSEMGKKSKYRCHRCEFHTNEIGLLKGIFQNIFLLKNIKIFVLFLYYRS